MVQTLILKWYLRYDMLDGGITMPLILTGTKPYLGL